MTKIDPKSAGPAITLPMPCPAAAMLTTEFSTVAVVHDTPSTIELRIDEVLLLPLTASDVVFDALMELVRGTGLAALIATHNMELAARMDRVLRLQDGVLVDA